MIRRQCCIFILSLFKVQNQKRDNFSLNRALRQTCLYLAVLCTCNPELCWKPLVSVLGSKCLARRHCEHVNCRNFSRMSEKNDIPLMLQYSTSVRILFLKYKNETQPPVWRHWVWSVVCFVFGPCQCPCLTPIITMPLHRYPLPPLLALTAKLILIFLFQSKMINQIFERKLSARYLYAAPRQKCRFKERAICKHEGSRCCTIKGNLKERGKVIEGQNESKVENFFVVATSTKMMFYFAPSSPMLKTLVVFRVTATKCHFSLSRCCNFRAVLFILVLNREFILHIFPFILQLLWEMENSLLLSHDFALNSWQTRCKAITSPCLAAEANRSQPCCTLPSGDLIPKFVLSSPLGSVSIASNVHVLLRSVQGCCCAHLLQEPAFHQQHPPELLSCSVQHGWAEKEIK